MSEDQQKQEQEMEAKFLKEQKAKLPPVVQINGVNYETASVTDEGIKILTNLQNLENRIKQYESDIMVASLAKEHLFTKIGLEIPKFTVVAEGVDETPSE